MNQGDNSNLTIGLVRLCFSQPVSSIMLKAKLGSKLKSTDIILVLFVAIGGRKHGSILKRYIYTHMHEYMHSGTELQGGVVLFYLSAYFKFFQDDKTF